MNAAPPLSGLKIVEMGAVGPVPMCAMLLADLGATVLRIDRQQPSGLGVPRPFKYDLLLRNRKAIALDLKQPEATRLVLELIAGADAVIEGFRPGVMERLGLGPAVCLERNPRLIFGRMTGWGQTGPLAHAAGHDLNYIAITGALHAIGRRGAPATPPLNLVGDYGGGSLFLALGILSALFAAKSSGLGQVVDASIVDGTAALMTGFFGLLAAGLHVTERGANVIDSGAYFYDVYECADGEWMSVAAIERKFHAELLERLDIETAGLPDQWDRAGWDRMRELLAARFLTRTRSEWQQALEGLDVCCAPVLSMAEAPSHSHLASRGTFIAVDGVVQPAPAPRFSRSGRPDPTPPFKPSAENAEEALAGWLAADSVAAWQAAGVFG